MEYSEFHLRTIVKVGANFGFAFFEVHPDSITDGLGIKPDGIRVKGEERTLPGGKKFITPFNSWSIKSKSDSKDINEHLLLILNRIEGIESKFKPEFGLPGIGVTYKSNYLYTGSGPILEAEVIEKIAKLRAKLTFDIYQVDQELSDEELNSDIRRITKKELTSGKFT